MLHTLRVHAFSSASRIRVSIRCNVFVNRYNPCRGYKHLSQGTVRSDICRRSIDKCCKSTELKFHTTRKLDIHPFFAIILRPLVNVGAFLFGRYFKKWWARQTPAQKEMYKKWLASKRGFFLGMLGACLSGLGLFYVTHLEKDPLIQRRRFIILNEKQQAALSKMTYEAHLEEHKSNLMPHHYPVYKRVLAIARVILYNNKDLPFVADESWTLNVVNSDLKNAYVLPGGHIFVFTGILSVVENDDQMAVILSHEIAHVLLKHPIEQLSNRVIYDILLAIPLAAIWAMFPDIVALFAQSLVKSMLMVILTLPYSRALETEADEVGLALAAKACVDVREAVAFWEMMKILTDMKMEPSELPWLSTHPDNEDRANHLNERIPEALKLRDSLGCKAVPRLDPRKRVIEQTAKEQEAWIRERGFIFRPNR